MNKQRSTQKPNYCLAAAHSVIKLLYFSVISSTIVFYIFCNQNSANRDFILISFDFNEGGRQEAKKEGERLMKTKESRTLRQSSCKARTGDKNLFMSSTAQGNRTTIYRTTRKSPSKLVKERKLIFTILRVQSDQALLEIRQMRTQTSGHGRAKSTDLNVGDEVFR